jgi:hypothetical protein
MRAAVCAAETLFSPALNPAVRLLASSVFHFPAGLNLMFCLEADARFCLEASCAGCNKVSRPDFSSASGLSHPVGLKPSVFGCPCLLVFEFSARFDSPETQQSILVSVFPYCWPRWLFFSSAAQAK